VISDEALMGYIDGHVAPDRRLEIEAALAADPALRARLTSLEDTDHNIRTAFDSLLGRSVPDRLVEAARAGRPASEGATADSVVALRPADGRAGLVGPLGRASGAARSARRYAPMWVGVAAGLVGMLVAAAALFQPLALMKSRPAPAPYHALGAAPDLAAINVMVRFRPETPEQDLREALRIADAQFVDGPTPAGIYLLHVPAPDRAAALAKLRRRKDILMAEPVNDAGAKR
jgi:hypothetical protein